MREDRTICFQDLQGVTGENLLMLELISSDEFNSFFQGYFNNILLLNMDFWMLAFL